MMVRPTQSERAAARLRLMLEAGKLRLSARAEIRASVQGRCLPEKKADPARARPKARGYDFDEILMHEHHDAMLLYPNYREFVERYQPEYREAKGLEYQTRRYAIGAKRRHRDIWNAIRAHERSHAGPIASPGNCVAASQRRLTL